MHISTVEINSQEWVNLEEFLTDWLGVEFAFDPAKTYRIQNISNMRITLVESEASLAEAYNEGEIILPYENYQYVPAGENQHLWIRGGGHYPLKITVTQVNGGTIQNIEQIVGDVNEELEEI